MAGASMAYQRQGRLAVDLTLILLVVVLSRELWSERLARQQAEATLASAASDGALLSRKLWSERQARQQAEATLASAARHGAAERRRLQQVPACVLDSLVGLVHAEDLANETAASTPLQRHPTSVSILQDAYVAFHRLMFTRNLLPLSPWGLGRCPAGSSSYCTAKGALAHSANAYDASVVVRFAMARFFKEFAQWVPKGAACLEWDGRRAIGKHLPNCAAERSWSFLYAGKPEIAKRAQAEKAASGACNGTFFARKSWRTLYGAVGVTDTCPDDDLSGAAAAFDVVLCYEVFEHVPDPFASARTLYRLLKPGGLVLWTAPFATPFHGGGAPQHDYFRYTADGAAAVFTAAGFQVEARRKFGDAMITSGYLMGFGIGDFEASHLRERLYSNWSSSMSKHEALFIGSALVLRRPWRETRK